MPRTHVDKKIGPPTKQRRTPKERPDLRSTRDIRRLQMYKNRVKRNEKGEITKGSVLDPQDKTEAWKMKRIAPDRRWFGNTRTIGQKVLEKFREELQAKYHDPYSVVLKQAKLPLTLLEIKDHDESSVKKQLDWDGTFGKKKTRKRPKLTHHDYQTMLDNAREREHVYEQNPHKDTQTNAAKFAQYMNPRKQVDDDVFRKGQSARIWNELYKVIDSSDVIIQVLDSRDPMGTRSRALEKYIQKEKKYKHLIFVLNKCDLIPTWATSRWVALLSREYPTIAFHASITNPFGKGNLINLIRQFANLHKATNTNLISVGLVGYPNVGKSSIINTLKGKKVCSVAPIPGETKVWQYIKLSRNVLIIDCPGVIHQSDDPNDTHQAVLKGVVRVERMASEEKADFVETVLKLVDHAKIADTYGIADWYDHLDFLDQLAIKRGKLHKGGVPDRDGVARTVLYDWQRAKIPWFTTPPFESEADEAEHRKLPKKHHLKIITDCQDTALKDFDKEKKVADKTDDLLKHNVKATGAEDEEEEEDFEFEEVEGEETASTPLQTRSKMAAASSSSSLGPEEDEDEEEVEDDEAGAEGTVEDGEDGEEEEEEEEDEEEEAEEAGGEAAAGSLGKAPAVPPALEGKASRKRKAEVDPVSWDDLM
eukprot:EG_transcript_5440